MRRTFMNGLEYQNNKCRPASAQSNDTGTSGIGKLLFESHMCPYMEVAAKYIVAPIGIGSM